MRGPQVSVLANGCPACLVCRGRPKEITVFTLTEKWPLFDRKVAVVAPGREIGGTRPARGPLELTRTLQLDVASRKKPAAKKSSPFQNVLVWSQNVPKGTLGTLVRKHCTHISRLQALYRHRFSFNLPRNGAMAQDSKTNVERHSRTDTAKAA